MVAKRQVKQMRAEDQTTVTFSCSKELKDMIQNAAALERRSVSNWIVCRLEDALIAMNEQGIDPAAKKAAALRGK
jgi:uncharacterized protein (DUF1778 family)